MKKILVYTPIRKMLAKVPIKNELFWYDAFYKKMLKFEATRIRFYSRLEEYVEITSNGILISRMPKDEATEDQIKRFGVQESYMMRPEPEILEKITYVDDTTPEKVKRWFDKYSNYNDTTATIEDSNNDDVLFIVQDDEIENFIYDLERNGIRHRIL